jgi:predicted permease
MMRLVRDARLGLRSLRNRPAFSVTAILTLGLGIGLSTAVFTMADALILRRLPVREQDRVVALWGRKPEQDFKYPLSLEAARDFPRRARTMERVGAFAYEGATPVLIRDGDEVLRVRRALVSGDFFGVLDARPHLGRGLLPQDDAWGAERAVVLSYGTWQRRFGGDTSVIGRRVVMHEDGALYTVVGVMPLGFDYPRGADFWSATYAAIPEKSLQYGAANLIGRLKPDATLENAQDELTAYFARPDAPAWERNMRGVSSSLPTLILGDTRPAVIAFAAASGLLLLIACLNVANLLLVRGLTRTREMAVRSALGAERGDLIRQLLTENALLALVGGVLGVLVAAAAVETFLSFAPETFPRLGEVHVSGRTLGGAFAISVIALLAFALAPALMASRATVHDALRSGTRQTAGKRSRLASELLVAGQVALALIVLSAAGLIARSLVKLERADLAFDQSRLLIAELALRYDQLDDVAKQRGAIDRALPMIERLPQVRSLSPVVAAPFSGTGGWDGRPTKEGQTPADAASNPMLNMEVVAPAYFETFGMPLLRGRGFTDADRENAPSVVVLSESAAKYYWQSEDPIGKRLRMGTEAGPFTVVGVVSDTRYRELREARPSIYFPLRQAFFPFTATTLAIRTRGAPADAVAALRRVVGDSTPGIALASATPFETLLEKPLAQPRLNALLLAVFASACVALSAIGLFGVMSTMVRQRTREFGVRMALGATPRNVQRMVMGRGVAIACAGLGVGLIGALATNRVLRALLYGVTPTDAATLVVVVALLACVAALASFLPARSSTRINVVAALRAEG